MQSKYPPFLFMLQMSAQNSSLQVSQAPTIIQILPYLHYGWKHEIFTHPFYCQAIQHLHKQLESVH